MTEFPNLLQAQNNLKPFEDLWHLIRDYQANIQQWTKDKVVFRLDPEAIEKETKIMFSTATKLTYTFPKSMPGPLKLAQELV